MDCDKAIYRVYGYLDGELTVWRRWTIRRHLGKCPPCAPGLRLRDRAAPGHLHQVPRRRAAGAEAAHRRGVGVPLPPDDAGPASRLRVAPRHPRQLGSRRPDPETPGVARELGPCPRRLRRDPVAGRAGRSRRAGAAPAISAVLADEKFKWFYWIGFVLAASLALWLLATLVGYYFRVIRPKHRGARPRDSGPAAGDARARRSRWPKHRRPVPSTTRSTGRSPRRWRAASAVASRWPPATSPGSLRDDFEAVTAEAEALVAEHTGLRAPGPARAQVVDRRRGCRPTCRRCDACSRRSPHASASAWRRAGSRRSAGGSPAPRPACCSATSRSACSGSTTCSCSTTTPPPTPSTTSAATSSRWRSASPSGRATSGCGSRSTRSRTGRSSPACRG